MTQAQGSKGYLAIQKESSYGVAPGAPDLVKIPFSSESLSRSMALETNDHISGIRSSRQPVRGNTDVAGNIGFNLGFYHGLLLFGALGAESYSSPTHTLKVGGPLPSFTIEKGFSDISQFFLYKGCKVSKLSLNIASSGFQKCTVDILGASETISGTSFDATQTDYGDAPIDGFGIASITEGGSGITGVTELSLNIDNNLDGDTFTIAGGGTRGSINEGLVTVSGTIKGFFENLTMLNKAINQTESSLGITYTRGTGAGTSGNEQLVISIPELVYSVKSPPITGPKGIYYELDWQGFWGNDAGNSACIMTLKNTVAAM
jgi:hypothetical protein